MINEKCVFGGMKNSTKTLLLIRETLINVIYLSFYVILIMFRTYQYIVTNPNLIKIIIFFFFFGLNRETKHRCWPQQRSIWVLWKLKTKSLLEETSNWKRSNWLQKKLIIMKRKPAPQVIKDSWFGFHTSQNQHQKREQLICKWL